MVTEEWRKLHNEELNDLYPPPPNIVRAIKSRRIIWAGHVVRVRERGGVYRLLVEKLEGKRPRGRPRHRWEDNIKIDLQEVGCGGHGLVRAGSGYGQVAGTCKCGNEPSGSINVGIFLTC